MEATKILLVVLLACVSADAWGSYRTPEFKKNPAAVPVRTVVHHRSGAGPFHTIVRHGPAVPFHTVVHRGPAVPFHTVVHHGPAVPFHTVVHHAPAVPVHTVVHHTVYAGPASLHPGVRKFGRTMGLSVHHVAQILQELESCPNPRSLNCDGPWTIIQKRSMGGVSFNRNWEQYKWGFPSHHDHDFWLGLEYVHQLTERKPYALRVTMVDQHGIKAEANYDSIKVDSEADNYKLHLGRWLPYPLHNCSSMASMLERHGRIHGGSGSCNAMDGLRDSDGVPFSTYDRDNDLYQDGSCGQTYGSGFWFSACFYANPNGHYGDNRPAMGIVWDTFRPMDHSLVYFEMAIKRAY